ncbi:MAG: hypothetical protein HYV09_07620 [Deltaproteobacteria bacterium]|nr:hypothetical protein [Deltaproteobacteria bacterium]
MPRPLRAAVLIAIGLCAPFAIADAPPAKLAYDRGPGTEACPDEPAMRQAVAARLGHDPFVDQADRTVDVRFVRVGSTLRGTIEIRDASGKVAGARTLESKRLDCKELAEAMTLAISLALDPLAGAPPKASASASASAPAPAAASAPASAPASASASAPAFAPAPVRSADVPPPPLPHQGLRVALGGHGGFGVAPRTNVGVIAAIGFRTPRWSVDLEGRRDLPATAELGAGNATSSLFAASLVPCLMRGPLGVCAIASIGALQASGSDVANARSATGLWAAFGVRLATEVPLLGPLAIGVHGDLLAPVVRTTLRLDGDDVYTTSVLAAALGARLMLHFD